MKRRKPIKRRSHSIEKNITTTNPTHLITEEAGQFIEMHTFFYSLDNTLKLELMNEIKNEELKLLVSKLIQKMGPEKEPSYFMISSSINPEVKLDLLQGIQPHKKVPEGFFLYYPKIKKYLEEHYEKGERIYPSEIMLELGIPYDIVYSILVWMEENGEITGRKQK